MNDWKERLLAYINALDDNIRVDEAEPLIHDELMQIKASCSEKTYKSEEINHKMDNIVHPSRQMEVTELIALYRDLFYGR